MWEVSNPKSQIIFFQKWLRLSKEKTKQKTPELPKALLTKQLSIKETKYFTALVFGLMLNRYALTQ